MVIGPNSNMEALKAELRQAKNAVICQTKRVRELTIRLESLTEEHRLLLKQNMFFIADSKRMSNGRLGKKREREIPRGGKKLPPWAQKELTPAQATHHQNGSTVQCQCQEMQLEATGDKIQTREELIQSYEAKLQENTLQLAKCEEEAAQQSHDFKEIMKHVEEDECKKINMIKLLTEKKLQTEKETIRKLNTQMALLDDKCKHFLTQFDEQVTEIHMLKQEKQTLLGLTCSQQSEIEDLREQNKRTSQERDNRIMDWKQKNQELQDLKLIHESQLSKLMQQLEFPQDGVNKKLEKLDQLREALKEMTTNYKRGKVIVSDLRHKLKAGDTQLHKEMQKMSNLETHLRRLKSDLHNCVKFIQEPRKLKESVLKIYAHYVSETERLEIGNVDKDSQRALHRQHDCLERTINTLKKRIVKSTEEHQKAHAKISKKYYAKITEINELRKELRLLRIQVKDYKAQQALQKKSNELMSKNNGSGRNRRV